MVGEIRDQETAEIALSCSQTGHMVLSTLHTNDSVSAIMRLADLGVPAALIASSMTAVIAQRLIRRLCHCRHEAPMTPQFAARLSIGGFSDFEDRMLVPVGCPDCEGTGYKGRVGVFEILVVDDELRHLIRSNASPADMRNHIRSSGLRTFQEEALDKVRQGLTSLEEVFRVVRFAADSPSRCRVCKRNLTPDFLLCPYCGTDRMAPPSKEEPVAGLRPVLKGDE
jgi:type II secretory ATPase GspE/PulE/Tfp pilus assembly ATPase PilB-like protein